VRKKKVQREAKNEWFGNREPSPGTISTYRLVLDESQSLLQLGDPNNPTGSLKFRIAGEDITLEGDLQGRPAMVHLVRSSGNFLLLRRGFHWINERPFVR